MAEPDVEIPKVGKLPKKVFIPLAVGLAGFVAWRYWVAKQNPAEESTIEDGEFGAVDSSIPGVVGAVRPGNDYGDDSGGSDAGNDPTRFTNNAQWTDYVVGKLQQSESWSYNEIVTAIGNGLTAKPTSDEQQKILRAAVAIGGQPPQGAIVIVGGGNTELSLAPTNLRVLTVSTTSVTLAWTGVPGAVGYVIESGAIRKTTSGTQYEVTGLTAGTSYTFVVSAQNVAGNPGPSASVSGKTAAIQPTGYRGYGWYKANGKTSGSAIAAKYKISVSQLQAWNPSLPATPPKNSYVKVRANSNPLTGYKGK